MEDSYNKISKITKQMKKDFGYIYAAYALGFWTTIFAPRQFPRVFLHNTSMKFTCSFSNTPGPLRSFEIDDKWGNKGQITRAFPFVMVGGRVGMCISCVSYGDNFIITNTCDDAICSDPENIVNLMESSLRAEIAKMEEGKKNK